MLGRDHEGQRRTRGRPASKVATAGLVLAVVAALTALAAGPGYRFGWWQLGTSFTLLQWGFWGSVAAAVVSAAGLIIARPRGRRRGMFRALGGLAIGLIVVGIMASFVRTGLTLPPIHDVTTDTGDPPAFQAILPLREGAPNPPDYGGPEIATLQQQAYPDIEPMITTLPPEEAFARALEAAGEQGWEVVAGDRAEGRIEAVDTTFWFGFADDIVVRIRPDEAGSRIDVRSKSRVGIGDLGANAARVRDYLQAVRDRIAAAAAA